MLSSCVFPCVLQKLASVLDELESLKPEFQRRVDELNRAHSGARFPQLEGPESTLFSSETSSSEWPTHAKNSYLSIDTKRVQMLPMIC